MANREISGFAKPQLYTGPDGDLSRVYIGNVLVGESSDNDQLYITELPVGMEINGVTAVVSDAAGATLTADVGTVQRGSGTWTDNDDQFIDGINGNSAGAKSESLGTHAPVSIDEEGVWLTITLRDAISSSNNAGFRIYVDYIFKGTP